MYPCHLAIVLRCVSKIPSCSGLTQNSESQGWGSIPVPAPVGNLSPRDMYIMMLFIGIL